MDIMFGKWKYVYLSTCTFQISQKFNCHKDPSTYMYYLDVAEFK